MDTDNENGNGNILTAKQGEKLNYVIEKQDDFIKKFDKFVDKFDRHIEFANARDISITKLEVRCDHVEDIVCDQGKKLDDVRVKSNRNDGLSVIAAAAFSAIAAWIGGSR